MGPSPVGASRTIAARRGEHPEHVEHPTNPRRTSLIEAMAEEESIGLAGT